MSEAAERARRITVGEETLPDFKPLKKLVGELKGELEFGAARKLLKKAADRPWHRTESVWIVQQQALCTYKDEELLPKARLSDSLELLETVGLLDPDGIDVQRIDPTTLPETLALGGAVHKRRWEYDGQIENLQLALVFYCAAWERDPRLDMGYGGVNAAYVLDILASRARALAQRTGVAPVEAKRLARRAWRLRLRMLKDLPQHAAARAASDYPGIDKEYWYLVTMAEVLFGLGRYEDAGQWLETAAQSPAREWERETTLRQLINLTRAQGLSLSARDAAQAEATRARNALRRFLGAKTERALSCFRGRVGLALSGGGFRASLFHIGVLARLAEADVLRSVEVLSTVSGGSILGAQYYLEVRHLLETKRDEEISPDDYAAIVERLEKQFLEGIEGNLRTRALSNLIANLKMVFLPGYSRSHRLGELYERRLFSAVADGRPPGAPRLMKDLLVRPAGTPPGQDFKPKFSNWQRTAKVPTLLLNATSLNSGHAWHFTARWMGEPPGLVGQEVDVNERYRRLWYDQAPTPDLRDYRLGHAVAASACVPGLFEPLVLHGLYPGRTVRLVDGGVHDNQGIAGLLNEGCTVVLCSDASGQMADQKKPSDGILGVPLRSNSVLQSRIRQAEYQDVAGRLDSRSLQGLMFVHLKKGLEALPLDWIRCQDPTVPPAAFAETTDYRIDKDLQRKLAAVRTDLDSFTEVEAYSLMLSGYLMTEHQLKALDERHGKDGEPGSWGDFDVNAPRRRWRFLDLEHLMRQPPDSSDARRQELGRQLEASASTAFKIWKLSPALRVTARAAVAAALLGVGWLLRDRWGTTIQLSELSLSFNGVVLGLGLTLAAVLVPLLKWLNPQEAMRGYLGKALVALTGFVFSNLHLWTFDLLYKRHGRLKRLLELR